MIKIYTTQNCGQCKILKKKMEMKKISFIENGDVEEMKRLGIQNVPVLELEDGTKLTQVDAIKWVSAQEDK